MSAERYLAFAHFVGGLTLLAIPIAVNVYRETQSSYHIILALFGLYAATYVPTVALATALTFRHLPNPKRQFGGVRVWGTIGWVLAGIGLSFWLERRDVEAWLRAHHPDWNSTVDSLKSFFHWLPAPSSRDAFRIAALLSFTLSTFCIFLPHTPPARTAGGGPAPLKVLGMFRKRSFVQLIVASFLLALVIPLYNLAVPPLLKQYGFRQDWIPAVMTIGQVSEPPALLLLATLLRRFGLKLTFGLGVAAWARALPALRGRRALAMGAGRHCATRRLSRLPDHRHPTLSRRRVPPRPAQQRSESVCVSDARRRHAVGSAAEPAAHQALHDDC